MRSFTNIFTFLMTLRYTVFPLMTGPCNSSMPVCLMKATLLQDPMKPAKIENSLYAFKHLCGNEKIVETLTREFGKHRLRHPLSTIDSLKCFASYVKGDSEICDTIVDGMHALEARDILVGPQKVTDMFKTATVKTAVMGYLSGGCWVDTARNTHHLTHVPSIQTEIKVTQRIVKQIRTMLGQTLKYKGLHCLARHNKNSYH